MPVEEMEMKLDYQWVETMENLKVVDSVLMMDSRMVENLALS